MAQRNLGTKIMRNTIVPAAYIVFMRNEDEILLSRRFNTGYEDGNYSLPAGHIEHGETAIDCIIREAKEEVGVTVQASDVAIAHVMYRLAPHQDRDRICFVMRVVSWQGEPKNMEADKCDDVSWFKIDALPENTIPYIRFIIGNIAKKITYSEWVKDKMV